jgi:hypothetical protein
MSNRTRSHSGRVGRLLKQRVIDSDARTGRYSVEPEYEHAERNDRGGRLHSQSDLRSPSADLADGEQRSEREQPVHYRSPRDMPEWRRNGDVRFVL